MNAMDPIPALRVSDADRHRATESVQEAYSEGLIDELELDQRLSLAMQSRTRRDLLDSVRGLPVRPARRPAQTNQSTATTAGGLAHLSGLVTWIAGPLLVYAVAPVGSQARRQAAEAFNFQLVALPLYIVLMVLGNMFLPDLAVAAIAVAGWIAWLVWTILGGARALAGERWRNPVLCVIPLRPLDPQKS